MRQGLSLEPRTYGCGQWAPGICFPLPSCGVVRTHTCLFKYGFWGSKEVSRLQGKHFVIWVISSAQECILSFKIIILNIYLLFVLCFGGMPPHYCGGFKDNLYNLVLSTMWYPGIDLMPDLAFSCLYSLSHFCRFPRSIVTGHYTGKLKVQVETMVMAGPWEAGRRLWGDAFGQRLWGTVFRDRIFQIEEAARGQASRQRDLNLLFYILIETPSLPGTLAGNTSRICFALTQKSHSVAQVGMELNSPLSLLLTWWGYHVLPALPLHRTLTTWVNLFLLTKK